MKLREIVVCVTVCSFPFHVASQPICGRAPLAAATGRRTLAFGRKAAIVPSPPPAPPRQRLLTTIAPKRGPRRYHEFQSPLSRPRPPPSPPLPTSRVLLTVVITTRDDCAPHRALRTPGGDCSSGESRVPVRSGRSAESSLSPRYRRASKRPLYSSRAPPNGSPSRREEEQAF